MKVYESKYLKAVKPTLKALLEELLSEYQYASILAVDSTSRIYKASQGGISIGEDELLSSRGFVIKIYDGEGYGEYSFNEISEDRIPGILKRIKDNLLPLKERLPEGVKNSFYAALEDKEAKLLESTEYEIAPETMGDEEIINRLLRVREIGKDFDEKILDCMTNCVYQRFSKLFISRNKDLEQNVMWTTGVINIMAARGEEIKSCYQGYSNCGGVEILDSMEKDVPNVAITALELLKSEPIAPGEYECICTPEVTGMIVHEAFGHGVEMDMFVKNRAQAKEFIGQYVASPLVTMHDGASAARETGTYFFDDEGTIAKDTVVIEKGILKRGISDLQSALSLGTEPTGNGRRESYQRKAYTRMTNTYFEGGRDTLEDMISSISYGFMLENPTSGMEDPKNWGIQCMVNIAREIKDGKLTGRIFSPIVLTGYVPDLLKSISMMSKDTILGGGGFCGKGYKEWVKVSDGGPYIKARIRLG